MGTRQRRPERRIRRVRRLHAGNSALSGHDVEDEASSGKHTEIALLKHLADTFDERLRKAEQAKDRGAGHTYNDGRSDAFGWAATYCRLMIERERRHEGKERDDA